MWPAPPRLKLARNEGGIAMGAFWTVVTFVFTFGVLALLSFALYHVHTAARNNSPRLRH